MESGSIEVRFRRAKQSTAVSVGRVRERMVSFLEHHCDYPLVDQAFLAHVTGDTGEERFTSLLARAGYPGDAEGFIRAVVAQLEEATSDRPSGVELGGVSLPYHLMLAVLEVLIPGEGFKSVKNVRQLEEITNVEVAADQREAMQRVLDLYPVRLSFHVIRQMRLSRNVARQYAPFVGELDPEGEVHTWVGQFWRGIVEQMYQNRVIFVMNMTCPTYCRFCFRKHKECRNQKAPTKVHVKQAIAYLSENTDVREVVLTGGDPFMNRATLQYAVQELSRIPHVRTLRLASRAVSYHPEMFLRDESYWLNYLVRTNLELVQKDKQLELATHLVHPDELSVDTLEIISHLVQHGIPVYVQTPLVEGCNESGREMVELFGALRAVGAEMHYIFMPTSPIQGNRSYWLPISKGLEAARYLRAYLSDRAIPHVTTATRIGKIDWNTSGWAVERDAADPRYLWIRTPYSSGYYEPFTPIMQVGDKVRNNTEGTLDAAFRVEIGDEGLYAGPRGLTSSAEAWEYKLAKTIETQKGFLEHLQAKSLDDQRDRDVDIGGRPAAVLVRNHWARVELDVAASDADLDAAYEYVRAHPNITDVVLSRRDDVLSGFSRTLDVVENLKRIPHVLGIRLRSLKLAYAPSAFSRVAIGRLASRNRLNPVRPTRIEVETRFLLADELRPEHKRLVRELRFKGITVYNDTPLLGYVNDNEEEMLRLSGKCREYGIEFCNVYVAGLPIQKAWNDQHPIELNSVIDIATRVRRNGSGREVPRYVLRTTLGEVDFSIAPRVFEPDPEGGVRVTLRPHDLAYFRAIDPTFEWPADVEVDAEGHPRVRVRGVSLENQEFLFQPLGGRVS